MKDVRAAAVQFESLQGDKRANLETVRRFAAQASARDVHSEDRSVIVAGQKGLSSGALKHIHFQTQEVLCRHLYKTIDSAIQAYQREMSRAEVQA